MQFIFLNLNMLKKISGWGLNTKYQVNLFFPKNINQLKKLNQTVLQEEQADLMEIVQFNQPAQLVLKI